jgi:hypothetical protein
MLFRMDARQHDDLIFTISQAILDARYAPPKSSVSATLVTDINGCWRRTTCRRNWRPSAPAPGSGM